MTSIFDNESVLKAKELIDKADKIVILTHMSPDGDALGSSLGMYHYLRARNKRQGNGTDTTVNVIVPNRFPGFLMWMPDADSILIYEHQKDVADFLIDEAELIICTDFNTPKRIGTLGEKLLSTSCPKILIDHHLYPDDFASVCFSFPQSASASEIVYRLIKEMDEMQQLPINTSTCIYTGMMTDTGNFSFNSNHCEMYEIVGELVRAGVDKDAVYNNVFNSYTADRMRLMGYCLYHKMQIFPEQHTSLIALSRQELYRFNFQAGDAEGIVNLPLQIEDIYYSCFMREDKVNPSEVNLANGSTKKVKISMRSQGDRPVNTFCQDIFNGGGHKNASGGEYYGKITDAVKLFTDNYKKYCR